MFYRPFTGQRRNAIGIQQKELGMCRKSYVVISGIIFGLVAIAHLIRVLHPLPVRIGDWTAPMWPSWAGLVVAGILSLWAFSLLCQKCEGKESPNKQA